MKMVIKKAFILFFLCSLFFVQCRRDDTLDKLPPPNISDTLQHGISAKIRDTIWKPIEWNVKFRNGYINFESQNDSGEVFGFWIYGSEPGLYDFNINSSNLAYFIDSEGYSYFSHSVYSNQQSSFAVGMANISKNSNDTISGSFIFNLFCKENNKYIKVSQGTFNNLVGERAAYEISKGLDAIDFNTGDYLKANVDRSQAVWYNNNNVILSFNSGFDIFEIEIPALAKGEYPINFRSKNYANFYPKDTRTIYSSLGSEASWGIVKITKADTVISGLFSVKLYNPIDKKYKIFQAGSFKNIRITKATSLDNDVEFTVNGQPLASPKGLKYNNIVNTFLDRLRLTYYDNLNNPRLILNFPKDVSSGTVSVASDRIDAFATYIDEKGKMYLSTEGNINLVYQDTLWNSNRNDSIRKMANFNFRGKFDASEVEVSNGQFRLYY